MRLRAIIYARVSTEMQEDNESLKYQIIKGQEHCILKGYDLYKIISDVESGGKDDRRGFNELQAEISKHSFDVLVVYETSRLSRRTLTLLKFVLALQEKDIKFVSISQPEMDTTTPTGALFFQLQASLSEYERKQISMRVKSNKLARAKSGKWQGGFLPIGYKKDSQNKIIVDIENSEKVKNIFQDYYEGESAQKIAIKYNMNISSIITILKNKFYIGLIPYGKRENNLDTNKVKIRKEFKYFFEGEHEAIIEKDIFENVNIRLNKRRRISDSKKSIFSSLIYCSCGGKLHRSISRGNVAYRCQRCKKSVSEKKLDDFIIKELFKMSDLKKLNTEKIEKNIKELEKKIDTCNINIKNLDKEKKQLLSFLTKSIITESEYIEAKNDIQIKIDLQNDNIKKYNSLIEFELKKTQNNDNLELLRNILKNIVDTEKEEMNSIMLMLIEDIYILEYKPLEIKIKLNI
jgi:resolvase domain-containing protein